MISNRDIDFSFDSGWRGDFTMNIRMKGKCLASVDGNIWMGNELEE